jgi:hypothetical protein
MVLAQNTNTIVVWKRPYELQVSEIAPLITSAGAEDMFATLDIKIIWVNIFFLLFLLF